MYSIPSWSVSAQRSVGLLYRPMQSIEIYVEDAGSEAFYMKLLKRAVNDQIKIKKIIPLKGREKVVEFCKSYEDDFPALFIIDGDLSLVSGSPEFRHPRLFQHRMYCVENYLFCEKASSELLQNKRGTLLEEEAMEVLDWTTFKRDVVPPLLGLFESYAVSWCLAPEIPTVSRSYHNLCRQVSRKRGSIPCDDKISNQKNEIENLAIEATSLEQYNEVLEKVKDAISSLDDHSYAISGKDYLLKALRDYLSYKGANYPYDDGFKFQLARYCDTDPLSELADAILETANGEIYQQAS
ncbi:DUF4435 domain-containing protein [Idiomarina sp. HB]|uniref:DUF4435 domain-containing protein n=1 Tax=Idiomarina sp. HB TaxID=3110479 RepID=UPI003A7F954A